METTSQLVPLAEMAKRLCVPPRWLKHEATEGRLPYLRAGDVFLFNVATVEAILLERAKGDLGDLTAEGARNAS